MASPGEVGFFDKIWDDLIDHVRDAFRVHIVEPITIGGQPIEVTTAVGTEVQITDGTDVVDVESYLGCVSLQVVRGKHHAFGVHLEAVNVAAKTGYMVIDLSDTVNWPHTLTNGIIVEHVHIQVNPDNTFVGNVVVGLLFNVDATNGDMLRWFTWHLDKQSASIVDEFKLDAQYGPADFFGPIDLNDTTWQTDVNLQGPDGTVNYPSGDGDFVLLVERSAGSVSISISVGYTTV